MVLLGNEDRRPQESNIQDRSYKGSCLKNIKLVYAPDHRMKS